MEHEDYTDFEQAKALKELGFNWGVRACYRQKLSIDAETPSLSEPKFIHNDTMRKCRLTNYNDNRCGGGSGKYFYSAPTLSQAFKWLREKYGLFVHVYLLLDDCWLYEIQSIFNRKKYMYEPEAGLWWQSYEEALSAGIDKALGLLKQQNNENQD